MSCLEPVGGCGYGLWNDDNCRCDCVPPICYDSVFLCASAGSCPDPFAGCRVDLDCPYSVDTSAGDCLSSAKIPPGVYQVFRTKKECCEANYPDSSTCGSASSPTGRPSILSPAHGQPSPGDGLFDSQEAGVDVDVSRPSFPVGPVQVRSTPGPTIDAGAVQEANRSDGQTAVIGVVVFVLVGLVLAFVIWRNRQHKGSDHEREERTDDCSSLDGMETSDANISIDIYNLAGQHDDGRPAATRVSSGQKHAPRRISARRYVQVERRAQNLSKFSAQALPQDPAGRHIHEDDEEEGKGYDAGQSTFHLHSSSGDLSIDTGTNQRKIMTASVQALMTGTFWVYFTMPEPAVPTKARRIGLESVGEAIGQRVDRKTEKRLDHEKVPPRRGEARRLQALVHLPGENALRPVRICLVARKGAKTKAHRLSQGIKRTAMSTIQTLLGLVRIRRRKGSFPGMVSRQAMVSRHLSLWVHPMSAPFRPETRGEWTTVPSSYQI